MRFFNTFIIFFLKFNILNSYQHNINSKFFKNIVYKKFNNHRNVGYKKSKEILFENKYDNIIYGKDTKNLNCEHIWCQKYFRHKEPMKSDLHIIFLCNSRINSHRQDYKFSTIDKNFLFIDDKGNIVINNFINKLKSDKLNKKNNYKKIFEPSKNSKGKVSRSVAYFNSIYNDTKNLNNVIENEDMINWNRKYLPSIKEIKRNEYIRTYQENINPFIKYPILLEIMYSKEFSTSNLFKLSFYTFYTIIISDLFKLNYILKKNVS